MRTLLLTGIVLLQVPTTAGTSEAADKTAELLALAREKFVVLTEADRVLLTAVAAGRPAMFDSSDANGRRLSAEEFEPGDRTLRADRLVWLCTDADVAPLLTHRGIWLVGAHVAGRLDLTLARIECPLLFVDCTIPEPVELRNAEVRELHLPGTHTGPIHAPGLIVQRNLVMNRGFQAEGKVTLSGAHIGGDFDCDEGRFLNQGEVALAADELKIAGDVLMRYGFRAEGEVSLRGARIGGDLKCCGGEFLNTGPDALYADGMKAEGDVFLRYGFRAQGRVSLTGAVVGGNLDCDAGEFVNSRLDALAAGRLAVAGEATLSDFHADGAVLFDQARIGGNLQIDGGRLHNPSGDALSAKGLKAAGDVVLGNGVEIHGRIGFEGAKIEGTFSWTGIEEPQSAVLDLRSAKIGKLWDEPASWPAPGRLFLNGLAYDELHGNAPADAASRTDWLRRQPAEHFWPQPYEHLAAVLRKSGREADAVEILIAKEADRYAELNWSQRCLHRVLGLSIGYGYRPWRALWIGLVVVGLGALVFGLGARADLLTATKEIEHVCDADSPLRLSRDYPKFNPLVYSLDMFVPLLDLHQANYWLPSSSRGGALIRSRWYSLSSGGLLRLYLGLHIYAGWTLTTLLAVGLSGLVQNQ